MTAIVDSFPLPWEKQEVRELQTTLSELYPSTDAILWVAAASGLNRGLINAAQPPFYIWHEVIDLAARTGALRALVEFVISEYPKTPKGEFLHSVLLDAPADVALDYTPRERSGAPIFLAANDQVTEQEALLFKDDLTLEFGRIPWLVNVLQGLQRAGGAVCKLDSRTDNGRQIGTGFRVGEDLILTNWHVLRFGGTTTSVVAEFGFEDDGAGGGLPTQAYECDCASIQGDADLDWAVIRTTAALPPHIAALPISENAEPVEQRPAFIIQHPGGQRKRISYVRNQITGFDDKVLHYLSDTQAGSSGSPVLNDKCQLIGLHRAGGRPQEVAGRQPLRKNEGVLMKRVAAGLAAIGVEVA